MKKYLKNIKNRSAFTLIEMLIVLVIVGLLMAIIIPNVAGQKARIEERAKHNIADIVVTQIGTAELVSPDESITLDLLVEDGYITQKQADEAVRLLGLQTSSEISKESVEALVNDQ